MKIGIVGGGLTGLATAFALSRAGHHPVVFEASEAAGGHVASKRRDGFVLEQGAGSLRGAYREVYQLLSDLELQHEVIPSSPQASKRYLLHQGQLVAMPAGPGGLFGVPRLGRRGALRLLTEPLRPPQRYGTAEETVHDFLSRRLGRRAADALANPLMAGIFAGDPHRLEVASAFPDWVRWEAEHGSVVRGAMRSRTTPPMGMPKGTFSVRGGLGTVVEALTEAMAATLRLSTPVLGMQRARDGVVLETSDDSERFDHVILTCPLAAARPLLPDAPASWLSPIPTADLAAIHLAYDGPALPNGLPGFGWLVHSEERADVLGALWVSGVFPEHAPEGKHLVRFMVGGTRAPGMAHKPDASLVDHALELMSQVQGVRAEPLFAEVNRASIPQYPPGFARRLRLLDQLDPRVDLRGWWWGQLGVAASARSAYRTVRSLRGR